MKIVINTCYGGFGLSKEAIFAYAARKGLTLYPEEGMFKLVTYWATPPESRPAILEKEFYYLSIEDRQAYNKAYSESRLYDSEIARDDADLVAVVEELGSKRASDKHAELKVVEIPDNVQWQIEEYDGLEHIAEVHRTWS